MSLSTRKSIGHSAAETLPAVVARGETVPAGGDTDSHHAKCPQVLLAGA